MPHRAATCSITQPQPGSSIPHGAQPFPRLQAEPCPSPSQLHLLRVPLSSKRCKEDLSFDHTENKPTYLMQILCIVFFFLNHTKASTKLQTVMAQMNSSQRTSLQLSLLLHLLALAGDAPRALCCIRNRRVNRTHGCCNSICREQEEWPKSYPSCRESP